MDKSDKRARMVARRRARNQTRPVQASAAHHDRIAPSASTASALSALFTYECDRDSPGVLIPRPEIRSVSARAELVGNQLCRERSLTRARQAGQPPVLYLSTRSTKSCSTTRLAKNVAQLGVPSGFELAEPVPWITLARQIRCEVSPAR